MKIEIVMTVWDNDRFKSRDRIEANSFHEVKEQVILVLEDTEKKFQFESKHLKRIMEDDDIPF